MPPVGVQAEGRRDVSGSTPYISPGGVPSPLPAASAQRPSVGGTGPQAGFSEENKDATVKNSLMSSASFKPGTPSFAKGGQGVIALGKSGASSGFQFKSPSGSKPGPAAVPGPQTEKKEGLVISPPDDPARAKPDPFTKADPQKFGHSPDPPKFGPKSGPQVSPSFGFNPAGNAPKFGLSPSPRVDSLPGNKPPGLPPPQQPVGQVAGQLFTGQVGAAPFAQKFAPRHQSFASLHPPKTYHPAQSPTQPEAVRSAIQR